MYAHNLVTVTSTYYLPLLLTMYVIYLTTVTAVVHHEPFTVKPV